MFFKLMVLFLLLKRFEASQQDDLSFTYNGFQEANFSFDGLAQITHNGLLMLTNGTKLQKSHTFYPHSLQFKNLSTGNVISFSSTFVFAMVSEYPTIGGPGIAFVITPSMKFPGAKAGHYLGLFNETNMRNSSNHVIAVELDSLQNIDVKDIDDNHVGIDINSLISVTSASASYFSDQDHQSHNLTLISGQPLQLWVEYNGAKKQLNVTIAPISVPKPTIPLLSLNRDLAQIIMDPMFVGFSSATANVRVNQYVLGWSFKMNGQAAELDLSQLPKLPRTGPKKVTKVVTIGIPVMVCAVLVVTIILVLILLIMKRKKKFAEVLEDWELEYGPHRFKYKDLYIATNGFDDKELLGVGGFGRVYRGELPNSKQEVAVKRISHDSKQGEREFIAEIVSIGKLRHRNIVSLLGYCRREGELLLVYDFMPNGSLDKLLYAQSMTKPSVLSWTQRFQIIKNVASALLYLHEEWEQVVIHRDVKSSNVLLDKEMNGRLGDFGLARLYDHGTDPQTTHIVGTLGYLAPELSRIGKANPSTDVFAFGAFMLEVACGRRPIHLRASEEQKVLVDWVLSCWSRRLILETVDPNLGTEYKVEEMEIVLKLGLLCSQSIPVARPSMRQVLRYLEGEVPLPDLSSLGQTTTNGGQIFVPSEGYSDVSTWNNASHLGSELTLSSSVADSILSGGR
ncbi:L-type lectin-domain containing receptor kinase IV.2-like [Macadamia integrifolia]|uniref:L-type lectin-domain containing receptor kinase IV.2-like n=1 Tax=Macadamia integrifolia TaxID=60698 RepID=UPI001C4F579D|nr:L-type lectin-domain containing receptor kinase IV.2-like [Macadamia integrifolia]